MPCLSPSASLKRLPQGEPHVLHRMVVVHLEVPHSLYRNVEEAMTGEDLQHVIEEGNARIHLRLSLAVEVEGPR